VQERDPACRHVTGDEESGGYFVPSTTRCDIREVAVQIGNWRDSRDIRRYSGTNRALPGSFDSARRSNRGYVEDDGATEQFGALGDRRTHQQTPVAAARIASRCAVYFGRSGLRRRPKSHRKCLFLFKHAGAVPIIDQIIRRHADASRINYADTRPRGAAAASSRAFRLRSKPT